MSRNQLVKRVWLAAHLGIASIALISCTQSDTQSDPQGGLRLDATPAMITTVETTPIASPGSADARLQYLKKTHPTTTLSHPLMLNSGSPVVSSRVTFNKSEILNRVFLYGSDVQYSSIGEEDGMLMQSLAIGHLTARFQLLDRKLQLIGEEKYRFESDINIPLRLIAQWPVLFETADQVTVEIASASPALAGAFGSQLQPRTSWVRSVDYVADGNYLMIESSVEFPDGTIAEFMESVFPRETLIKDAPAPILADSSRNEAAGRYDFLANGVWLTLPEGRVKTAVAQRFARPPADRTIDWYVTGNIPAEYVPAVRDGIEGWNRYSQKMWGRDFVRFKGKLPAGVKLGDPRYNVVNWDSVVDASAAYESQASDPETGLQSHSLIYLPYAWVTIGKQYWERGGLSQDRTAALRRILENVKFLDRKIDLNCFNEGEMAIDPKMKDDPETFAAELLKGVLFHEVGHALGLAHNFKGSLSYNPDDAQSMFSSSIMDYNQYQIEHGAFDGPGAAAGPLLEYDRQILSVLYNDGVDVAATDPVLPHCNDQVTDSTAGGVDPFCIRYDAGADPTAQLTRTIDLISDPAMMLGKTKSLAAAIESAASALPTAANATTAEDVTAAEDALFNLVSATTQFYVSAGAQGLNYMLSANLRALKTYRAEVILPATTDAQAVRQRVAKAIDTVLAMDQLPPPTRKSYEKLADAAVQWVKTTVWYGTATQNIQANHEASLRKRMSEWLSSYEASALPRVRARMLTGLARTPDAPFFLDSQVDYEAKTIKWFENVLLKPMASGQAYSTIERSAAATALRTFADVPGVDELKAFARTRVDDEIKRAGSAEERESLRSLKAQLN